MIKQRSLNTLLDTISKFVCTCFSEKLLSHAVGIDDILLPSSFLLIKLITNNCYYSALKENQSSIYFTFCTWTWILHYRNHDTVLNEKLYRMSNKCVYCYTITHLHFKLADVVSKLFTATSMMTKLHVHRDKRANVYFNSEENT